MNVLIFGGAGFVGRNIAAHCLASGDTVSLFDREPVDISAFGALTHAASAFASRVGDVTDIEAIRSAITPDIDVIILGAAITAGSARDAREPSRILAVNLMAQIPILEAARDAGVRRTINLSSAAAYGASGERFDELAEDTPTDPVGLYAITKLASEKVGARLASLWGTDHVSVRLSGVFGPWEHATGVRDTLSPLYQVAVAIAEGRPALLDRPGLRDWTYSRDIAEAIRMIALAPSLKQGLYNISTGKSFSVLDWGRALARHYPGAACRLCAPGEVPTIDLFGPKDRAPMAVNAIANDIGWRARFGLENSVADLLAWQNA